MRAHIAAKSCGLKLIVGTEVKVENGPKLVLLATDRAAYGRMCALITKGRMRTPKGTYRIETADLDDGLDGCLALLIPEGAADLEHARLVAARFPQRAWIAAELLLGDHDAAHMETLRALSRASGLPLVAAGDVHMHLRSRRALQDVLTAIRLGVPVHAAGDALFPNAERHLRTRAAPCGALRAQSCCVRPCASPSAAASISGRCATNILPSSCPKAKRRRAICANSPKRDSRAAFPKARHPRFAS